MIKAVCLKQHEDFAVMGWTLFDLSGGVWVE